ncbi:hypothetical protein E3T24_00185 [Cryobacterium sp. TmT2-59]|uniref:hypothetical protein n=1 Tax=Cryobacterium sp. TmT2-59 TaxID=1259264 RepID=UPI00106A8691|nr:hypothetical protein [Cryobacterium sp. TmT2-59]TFC90103.1 hypothetical protein E3T24_00185 [Cryobacterium sp. TmT2-59]
MKEYEAGFWESLFIHLAGLDEDIRRTEIRTRKYEGEVRAERSPALSYLYIGKLRPGSDWPDIRDSHGVHASLASTGVIGALIEPAYLLPISGTNYLAVLRSSSGPTFSAITEWLNHAAGFVGTDDRLELRPYARHDQLERLARAQGATRIHLKVDPDALHNGPATSEVGRAMQSVQNLGAGGVSVEMIVSYGNSIPDEAGAEALAEGVRDLVESGAFKTAKATLLVGEPGGHLAKDSIDFTLDRVTLTEEIGDSEDEEPLPAVILSAMSEAIRRFREKL